MVDVSSNTCNTYVVIFSMVQDNKTTVQTKNRKVGISTNHSNTILVITHILVTVMNVKYVKQ